MNAKTAPDRPAPKARHDARTSNTNDADAPLLAGQSAELLKALHILTRDGRLNQDSRRKLK